MESRSSLILGDVANISSLFIEFQKYLYEIQVA